MIDSFEFDDSVSDIEALIRAAGDYVQPSDDLRPRVMEAARFWRMERRTQWRLGQAAVLFILLNLLATSTLQRVELADGKPPAIARDAEDASGGPAYRESEHWDTVDAFRELRRRQASLLRLQL